MKSIYNKSLVTKSVVRTGIIVASLALAGNAFAANDTHVAVNALRTAHPAQTHAAAPYQQQVPIAQIFGGLVGLPIPVVTGSARDTDDGSYDWSSSYDNSAPAIDESSAGNDAMAASEEEDQEIQSMNDTNALTASMAAAEEQNDEANAATLQTEINAGLYVACVSVRRGRRFGRRPFHFRLRAKLSGEARGDFV